ncbi:hypothetical protein CFBP6624_04360 [Agrobacterium tumefaciens]|uniref:Uncharacterized protein n=1 Tax=Agrobacterium tumefaciens TaxID=358 RepID=A0AAE6EKR5_AGRTU|nr:hypothetical protein CFBP6624_04360 [Agrobacterium tumefaciens]
MVKAPETVMRWRLSVPPGQEQYEVRDLPVKTRRCDKKRQCFYENRKKKAAPSGAAYKPHVPRHPRA